METPAFAAVLERHRRWRRDTLPGIDTRQGMALLIWLLKNPGQARPIGELYKAASLSEPTMRESVKAFVDRGLAAMEIGDNDSRQRLVRGTAKLEQKVQEYREWLVRLGEVP
jgi:DNA-binding MarR family transcriptional regulator